MDLLIVDHYSLDKNWEEGLRPYYKKLMVIDDLANREHVCDLLLDQTFGRTEEVYRSYLPNSAQILIGAQFSLVKPEFAHLRQYSLERRKQPAFKKILITMGGVDQFNATAKVLDGLLLSQLPKDCKVTIVMGMQAPHLANIKARALTTPWQTDVKENVENMANLMADADLAIGAAGSTSWERCCLGLPTLLVVLADNQLDISRALAKNNAVINIGNPFSAEFCNLLADSINKIISSLDVLSSLSHVCRTITDGQGVSLVTNKIQSLLS